MTYELFTIKNEERGGTFRMDILSGIYGVFIVVLIIYSFW